MKRHTLALSLALACGSTAALAAPPDFGSYGGVMGSYIFTDKSRQLDEGLGGRLYFGFPITPTFSAEFGGFYTRADREYANGKDDLAGLGLDFNWAPFSGSLTPFLLAGGGAQFDDTQSGREDAAYLNAGGGLLIRLGGSRNATMRFEGRRVAVFNDNLAPGRDHIYDTQVGIGAQFNLSATPPPAPAPVEPVAPPPVLDTDGDGVPDDRDLCPGTPPGTAVDARGCPLPPPDSDGDGVPDNADACPDTPRGLQVDARGCAIKAQVLVLRDINFEFNKSVLTTDARLALDKIAAGLRGQPTMEVRIEGHTDSVGSDAYNLRLSKARAEAVRTYLMQRGIATNRMTSEGYGESKPVADNNTEEGRAMNRRVEFKVEKQ